MLFSFIINIFDYFCILQLCSKVRILPSKYIDFRRILMNESEKVGHLRLATARNLIKVRIFLIKFLFFINQKNFIDNSF